MKDTLNARFRAPLPDYYRRRIIVWKDETGEFADTVADLQLENARVLTMRPNAMFELRRQIEVDFADENLLLYCPRITGCWMCSSTARNFGRTTGRCCLRS